MKVKVVLAALVMAALATAAQAFAATRTGSPRADTLLGTPNADILLGRGGNDRLVGRGGTDLLSGGRGRDVLVCGRGLDAVVADRADRVHASCELVASRNGLRSSEQGGAGPTTGTGSSQTAPPESVTTPEPGADGGEPGGGDQSEDDSLTDDQILAWLFPADGDPDWREGLALFGLGLIGAVVLAYFFLGEFLPSMGGKANYESDTWDARTKKDTRDKLDQERRDLAGKTPLDTQRVQVLRDMSNDLTEQIEEIEKRSRSERWRLFLSGLPMYVLLGGAFATIFATTLLQAFLIGFGWVALANRLGLRREKEEEDDIRGREIKKLEEGAEQRTEEAVKLREVAKRLDEELAATESRAEEAEAALASRTAEIEAEREIYTTATAKMARQVEDLRAEARPTGTSTPPQQQAGA